MVKNLAVLLLSSAALALSLGSVPAQAQTSTDTASAGIEEITVTATRREEKLSKVPASVSAYTAEKMDTLDVKNFQDLVKFTPGVTFNEETSSVSIRGVDSDAGDATTGIYIDDTPIQLRTLGFGSDNTLPAVFDLQRVEVLRGPQGTLFGAGSEGGTIRYITPAPSLTDYSVYAKSEISTTQDGAPSYEAGLAVGGPIVDDTLGFRASAWYRHDGGYIDHINYLTGDTIQKNANYTDTFAGRAAFGWQPRSDLLITPSIFYQNRKVNDDDEYWVGLSDPDSGRYINATPERMANQDHFTLSALKIDWSPADSGVEFISDTSYFQRHQVVQDYSGTLYNLSYFQQYVDAGIYPFANGSGTNPVCRSGGLCGAYAAQIKADPSFTGAPLLTANGINLPGFGFYESTNYITNSQENFTQEFRLQSADPDARLTWVAGAFYSRQSQLSIEEINDPQLAALTKYLWGDPTPPKHGCDGPVTGDVLVDVWCEDLLPNGDDYINHTNGHEKQAAVYANATFAITPQLKIQAGARFASTHFDFSNFSDGAQNFGPLTGNKGHENEKPFTPMGGITYQINDDDMVYATAAKGYRIGGANPPFPIQACAQDLKNDGLTSAPEDYSSDTVTSYEVGSKDKFFGGRLQTSGSAFYLKWNNIQQENEFPICGFKYTTNLGQAASKGFDLDGEWLVTDALDVDFSAGYIDAEYTSNATVGTGAGAPILAAKGDKLPGSPWTFTIGAQYNANVWNHDSFLRVDYEYASREIGETPDRDPATAAYFGGLVGEPETNVVQVRAGTTLDNIAVALFADNLLDAHPRLNLSHQNGDTLLYEENTLRPRTIGLTGTYRY
jgi:outer membrane receptor protein involved in Fe transport